jgi:rubredoxin
VSRYQKADAYSRCPDCHKKGVTLRLRPGGEDFFACRYCDWSFYAGSPDALDREEEARWEQENPLPDQTGKDG